jgi:hypothetical protein
MKKILLSLIVLISVSVQAQKNHFGIYRYDSLYSSLAQWGIDTTNFKLVAQRASDGKLFKMNWPVFSSGSTPTLQQVLTAGNTATNKTINLFHPSDASINTSISYNGYTAWNGNEHTILGYNYLAYTADAGTNFSNLFFNTPTATRNIYLQNKSGTVALLSDITDSIAAHGSGGGETNTASNANTAGVGVWYQKSGVDLQFKGINNGSSAITVTNNTTNHTVDIDIAPENLNISSIGGTMTKSQLDAYVSDANVNTYNENSIASNATWSPAGDSRDNFYDITAQAAAVTTINAPSGTPANHNTLLIRVTSDASNRAIGGWNAIYRAGTNLALPTTTTASKTMYIKFIYNSTASKWDLVSVLDGL